MIRFYLKLDPDKMEEEEWCRAVNDVLYCLELNKKLISSLFK